MRIHSSAQMPVAHIKRNRNRQDMTGERNLHTDGAISEEIGEISVNLQF